VAIVVGVFARLAAMLSVVQIGLMTVLVWAPIMAAGHVSEQHWIETVVSCALTAGAWVIADSYRAKSETKGA
jgi:general stress protein CsbA